MTLRIISKGYRVDVNLSIMADTKWPRIEYMARFVSAVRSALCRVLLPPIVATLTRVMPARRHWRIWVKVWQYNYKKITHYKSVFLFEKIYYIKPLTPNDVHLCMCQYVHRCMWTKPSLVQIMPCRLLGANPWLNQCGLTCCYWTPRNELVVRQRVVLRLGVSVQTSFGWKCYHWGWNKNSQEIITPVAFPPFLSDTFGTPGIYIHRKRLYFLWVQLAGFPIVWTIGKRLVQNAASICLQGSCVCVSHIYTKGQGCIEMRWTWI